MERDTKMDGTAQGFALLPAAAIGFLMYGAAQQLIKAVPPANDQAAASAG